MFRALLTRVRGTFGRAAVVGAATVATTATIAASSPTSVSPVAGKNIVITGANTGLGKETAYSLSAAGAHVVMACRSQARTDEAINDLVSRGVKRENLQFVHLDLGSLPSVREFVRSLRDQKIKTDVLINNAGFWAQNGEKTEQGFEGMFGTNHLGHFYLTQLMLANNLIDNAHGRIVILTSRMMETGKMALDEYDGLKKTGGFQGYANSKLYNVMYGLDLQRRLKGQGSGIEVFMVHPGLVKTDFLMKSPGFMGAVNRFIARFISVEIPEGAKTQIYAASAPELAGKGGSYLVKEAVAPIKNKLALDPAVQKQLWDFSEKVLRDVKADMTL